MDTEIDSSGRGSEASVSVVLVRSRPSLKGTELLCILYLSLAHVSSKRIAFDLVSP